MTICYYKLMIKALIFDLDGTLIDRQKAFTEGMTSILRNHFDDEKLIKDMLDDIILWDARGSVERIIVFTRLVSKYDIENVTAEELDLEWKSISGKTTYLYDDVRDTLTKLKEKYKIGILSNGATKTQRRKMDTCNIYDLIDYSLISSEYICWKPDERVFIYACTQMGFKPEECAYIGDSYTIDIEGSLKANMMPVFVNRTNENHLGITTINQIKELLNIF